MRLQHLGIRLHKRVIHYTCFGSLFPFLFKKSLQNHCFCLLTETVINLGKSSVWLIEQGLTCARTQYRLYGRRFLQVWWPNQQCQSTEGGWLVIQTGLNLTMLISLCYNTTTCMPITINAQQTSELHVNVIRRKHLWIIRSEICRTYG